MKTIQVASPPEHRIRCLQFSLELKENHKRTREHLPRLYEFTLDLDSGAASSRLVDEDACGDFPVISPSLAGAPLLPGMCVPLSTEPCECHERHHPILMHSCSKQFTVSGFESQVQ